MTATAFYGLEAYYDDYLSGTDGKAVYAVAADGRKLQNSSDAYYSAVDGYSLVLTLDEVLQHYLEKNLELCVSQHQVINRACGIIMNCNTGAVLAMATAPSFDLNNPSELKSSFDLQTLAEMKESGATEEELDAKEASLREQQWKNKAITELYYPFCFQDRHMRQRPRGGGRFAEFHVPLRGLRDGRGNQDQVLVELRPRYAHAPAGGNKVLQP